MPAPKHSVTDTASSFLASHGHRAAQKVVDQIILCIREHDLVGAKKWEEVGRIVDHSLDRELPEAGRKRSA
jgi:hypothetical protein